MSVNVIKYNGESEPYSEEKIRSSAGRVGVPSSLMDEMLGEIRAKLYDGIKTSEIFDTVKSYLSRTGHPHLSLKFDLRQALAELGPSGYPFEKYLALLLNELGYTTEINQILPGKCVSHEVDIIAQKSGITYFVEAKFHSKPHQRTDIKVPLYIRARYEDLAARLPSSKTAPWIITNTRFSTDAIVYANCREFTLTSWGYPKGEGIMDLIESTKLFPVTMLDSLTHADKLTLLKSGVVICQQLLDKKYAALIPASRRGTVLSQIKLICENHLP